MALAVASAARGIPLAVASHPLACFGELGLTGELRTVGHTDRRLSEAKKFGLGRVLHPGTTPTIGRALRDAFSGPESGDVVIHDERAKVGG